MRSRTSLMLAVGGVAALALAVPMAAVRAAETQQAPPRGGQGQYGGPGQVPPQGGMAPVPGAPMPGGQMGGGGGGATMVVEGNSLYILRGNQLLKVSTSDLSVQKQAELPMPARGQRPGGTVPPPAGPGGGQQGQTESK